MPDTVYILENEDGEYVGIFNFRHCLNDFLRNGPGHIGYGIGPKYHKDNPASLRVQMKNGAYIHGETEQEYLTRIPRSGGVSE